jgi:hypothetical protein
MLVCISYYLYMLTLISQKYRDISLKLSICKDSILSNDNNQLKILYPLHAAVVTLSRNSFILSLEDLDP